MKWFAIICVLAILGSGLALGPKCKGEDPKIFDGLSQIEIEVICGKDNDSEKKAKRQTLQEKCKKRDPKLFAKLSSAEIALLCPDKSGSEESKTIVKFAPDQEGDREKH
ncbi:unnamed protein product [Heligmosomoides polygyrus]|uniref:Secreted protein n=1 Tax=Heligmosomoides polygyrus TaxID=6339 RepID=A0A183F9N6_HELPZ|nr:unnamed protein product [Heligmosomoides polygyrus]